MEDWVKLVNRGERRERKVVKVLIDKERFKKGSEKKGFGCKCRWPPGRIR